MSEDIATVTRLRLELASKGTHLNFESMKKRRIRCAGLPARAASSSTVLSRCSRRSYGFRPGYADLCEEMTRWKEEPETSWLKEALSQPLQQSLKNLEDAWDRHFGSLKDLKAGKIKASQASRSAAVQEEGAARQAFAFHKDSNSIRKTAECSYRNLAGFATATARRSSGEVR